MKMKNSCIAFMLISFLSGCSTTKVPLHIFYQPDNPEVSVSPIIYHSPFSGYQPLRPLTIQSWSKANESVRSQPMNSMQHMNMPMTDPQEKSMSMDKKMESPHPMPSHH